MGAVTQAKPMILSIHTATSSLEDYEQVYIVHSVFFFFFTPVQISNTIRIIITNTFSRDTVTQSQRNIGNIVD